jgi:hypothetical protein
MPPWWFFLDRFLLPFRSSNAEDCLTGSDIPNDTSSRPGFASTVCSLLGPHSAYQNASSCWFSASNETLCGFPLTPRKPLSRSFQQSPVHWWARPLSLLRIDNSMKSTIRTAISGTESWLDWTVFYRRHWLPSIGTRMQTTLFIWLVE